MVSFPDLVMISTDIIASSLHARSGSAVKKARDFATDICLVASGVRKGYLLDTFSPTDPVLQFSRALTALREVSDVFGSLVHIFDPSTEQSFFGNVLLLQGMSGHAWDETGHPTFDGWTSLISLTDPPSLCHVIPPSIPLVLDHIFENIQRKPAPLSVSLPDQLTQQTLVPLAAFLLEYPVGYVPTSSQQTLFLSKVPLDIFECHLLIHQSSKPSVSHTLLKFSCPRLLGADDERLSITALEVRLQQQFQSRLDRVDGYFTLQILHHVETLDRVGL